MGRIQGTVYQVRRLRDESLRYAELDSLALLGARTSFRANYLTLQRCEWDAAFWAKENPERSKGIGANVPRLRKYMANDAASIARLEAEVLDSLATARKAAAALAHAERKAAPRQAPDLWVLAVMCWRGWLAKRGNSMQY